MSDRIDEARRRIETAINETDNSDHARGLSHADRILRSLPEAADERWEKLRGNIRVLADENADNVRPDYVDATDDVLAEMAELDRLLSSPPAERSDEERVKNGGEASCEDCGRRYGDQYGFPDLIINKDAWQQISPSKDDGGLLCPSCIVKRLCDAEISCEGAFMSGPIRSVDSVTMHNTRWIENLRVQGHGWACPECNCGRHQSVND